MQYLEDILELIEDLPEEIARRFEKIRRLDAEINESMRAYKALRVRLLGQSVSQEEKQRLCSEAAQIFIKARRLGDQKLEIAERSQYLMSNVSDKVSESAYHCKIELEVDHCGITEVIERSFCSSRGLHPPDMKDCQVKFILDPMEQNEISSYVDAMLPAKPRAFKDDLLCPPARNKGVPVKRKREKTSRGRGRPPKHDPLALCSAYNEADDASSRASSTRDEDSIANLLNDFGSSVDDDLTDFADIFPQMPSPPREILDIIKDDSVSVFSLEQELSIGALGSPRAESPSRLNERKRKALFTGATEVSLHGRQRKLTTRVEEMISEKREKERRRANRDEESHSTLSDLKEEMEEEEDNYTVWCICKKPSAGEMICCDNEGKCRIQWFHFECLGLTEAPAGSWFCPECKARQQQTASTRA